MASKAAAGDQKMDEELDPKFEWLENATNFLLRIKLSGFKKEDFRVQVDGAGRLTVRGQRSAAAADGKHAHFHKVFQLPSVANIDDITGRFEANVLTITVPKRPAAAPPATIQEIKNNKHQQQQQQHHDDAKPGKQDGEDAMPGKQGKDALPAKPGKDDAVAKHNGEADEKKEEDAAMAPKRSKQDQQEHKPTAPALAERPRAELAAAPSEKQQAKPIVDRESLTERVKQRRAEEERAAAAAEEKSKTTAAALISGWRERVAGELEQLADMKWADGVVEAARKHKEVVAVAVAAFSLGFFVSQKLFSRR